MTEQILKRFGIKKQSVKKPIQIEDIDSQSLIIVNDDNH